MKQSPSPSASRWSARAPSGAARMDARLRPRRRRRPRRPSNRSTLARGRESFCTRPRNEKGQLPVPALSLTPTSQSSKNEPHEALIPSRRSTKHALAAPVPVRPSLPFFLSCFILPRLPIIISQPQPAERAEPTRPRSPSRRREQRRRGAGHAGATIAAGSGMSVDWR